MKPCLFALLAVTCVTAETVANLEWKAPAGWVSKGQTDMRAATYPVQAAPADSEGGECVVYFFGKGQGGTVEANITRWSGQFLGTDGKPEVAKVLKRTVHMIPVTTIDVSGAYTGMGGPLGKAQTTKNRYRLLGAILENPDGNVFIKFTAPEKTVAANQQKFEALLNSFSRSTR
jgi:hypothetical protein